MRRKKSFCHSCGETQTFIKPDDREYYFCAVCGKTVTDYHNKEQKNNFKKWGLL